MRENNRNVEELEELKMAVGSLFRISWREKNETSGRRIENNRMRRRRRKNNRNEEEEEEEKNRNEEEEKEEKQ